jgi:copper transport protein
MCSELRELLSARMDGESTGVDEIEVSRHLATCPACTAYAAGLARVTELVAPARERSRADVPGPGAALLSAVRGRPAPGTRTRLLRIGVVALAGAELVAAALQFIGEHGYGGEDHAGHESLSFSLALCAGLIWIAWRPAYARGYLPMVGVAACLLTVTAYVDLTGGRARVVDEVPHLGLVAAYVLLWLLSRGEPRSVPSAQRPSPGPSVAARAPRLRMIRGALRSVVAVAVPAVVLVAAPSWGHATLESSDPATGAVLRAAPHAVTLRFDEAVSALPGALQVYGPDGTRVDDGAIVRPGGEGAQVSTGVTGTQRGTYLVSWRVVSADSHPVSGAFTFSVGRPTAAPSVRTERTDPTVATVLGAFRWLGYAGSALGLGGLAFLSICWPEGWAASRARRLIWCGLVASVVAAVAGLLVKGPYDAALGLASIGRGDLLREVLGSTYGRSMVARLVLLAVLSGLLLVRARVPARLWVALAGVVGVALLPTFALTGHAVSDHPRWLAVVVDSAHVGGMSVWLGGLVCMFAFVLRADRASDAAGRAVRRFSSVALVSVVVLLGTGTYQAWRQVGSWAALPHTTYGRELLVKLSLVAVVLGVAGLSRLWVRSGNGELRVLRRRVGIEAGLVAVILGLTSALVATEPARSAYRPSISADLVLGPDSVHVSAVPSGDRRMEVRLDVLGRTGQPTEPAEVQASVSLPSQSVGPIPLRLTKVGAGHRIADLAVPIAGTWRLAVVVRTTAIDEYVKTVDLPIH